MANERRLRTRENKGEKYAQLRDLKQRGESRIKTYEVQEDIIYDEVDEKEYSKLVKSRLEEQDFVVDDDGSGYVDHGTEDWGQEGYSDEFSDDNTIPNNGTPKRKRNSKSKKENKVQKEKINPFFTRAHQNLGSSGKNLTSSANEQEFMNSLLNDVDTSVNTHILKKQKLTSKMTDSQRIEQLALFGNSSETKNITRPEIKFEEDTDSTWKSKYQTTKEVEKKVSIEQQPSFRNMAEKAFAEFQDIDFDDFNDDLEDPMEGVKSSNANVKIESQEPISAIKAEPISPEKIKAENGDDKLSWMKIQETLTSHMEQASSQPKSESTNGTSTLEEHVLEEDGSLDMYWIDVFEKSGSLYFFGKVFNRSSNSYISCCLAVNNLERNVFVLPRETKIDSAGNPTDVEVTMSDVYQEFRKVCTKYNISAWGAKEVVRKYAFEIMDVPAESDYLKAVYSYNLPQLPSDLTGETFERVFGTNTPALESFIIKRNIMGPCWLKVKNPQFSNRNISWCKLEVNSNNPKDVNPVKECDNKKSTPPLTVLSLSLKTVMNRQKHANEIVMASTLVYDQVPIDSTSSLDKLPCSQYTVVRQLNDMPYPVGFNDQVQRQKWKLEVSRTERALLNYLIAIIHKADPDVIVGHNFMGFDLDVLLHRMKANKVDHWSRLGRLRRTQWPQLQAGAGGMGDSTYAEKAIVSGRIICDTYLATKDLIRATSYSLSNLAKTELKISRENIEFEKIPYYFNSTKDLSYVIKHCEFDAYLTMALMFKLQVLPLTKQLTNLAGNLWSRTMTGARAERNEYLLLHEFHRNKYICPDKTFNSKARPVVNTELDGDGPDEEQETRKTGRRKPAYTGGLVLEPKKGLYDKYVLLLDFNSLYPSIIQEFNICFTTVERKDEKEPDQIPEVPDTDIEQGVLPRLIHTLVEKRRTVKGLMKDPRASPLELEQYDVRQKALKLTANSMYGCLGFTHSRFYAKQLAMLITSKGREILQNTVDLAQAERLDVIYGDTDSIMINTNSELLEDVRKIGSYFKKKVNERYRLLELEMDGVFKRMLLLKKKKYAALKLEERDGKEETVMETKGLDLVRRDWCDLSHDVSNFVLQQIFSGDNREEAVERIHKYLVKIGEDVRNQLTPINKFIINKGLTKNPEDYADAKSQPHVQVALRMKSKGISIRAGDTVPFVICKISDDSSNTKSSYAERAYHPDDVTRQGSSLTIDIEWYLNQQVHPPVARLCDPIEGTDAAHIAHCLGLDSSKYHSTSAKASDERFTTLDSQIPDADRFKNAVRFSPKCRYCHQAYEFVGTAVVQEDRVVTGFKCPNASCGQLASVGSLAVQLKLAIRSHISQYNEGWLVCEDPQCGHRSKSMSVYGRRCLMRHKGVVAYQYNDTDLYTQLKYYESLFDEDKIRKNAAGTEYEAKIQALCTTHRVDATRMKDQVSKYLSKCGRRYVDLAQVFSFCKI
ncbi:DNA-directed DNA polymerase alpha catalytic subunit pol1 [Basidiobolus ranarum]|uniref:DNA polymerase n=1 Tax=Basidiobolus ranarum TaxID=34480 RepID=A0ABR2WKB1_9FUNG